MPVIYNVNEVLFHHIRTRLLPKPMDTPGLTSCCTCAEHETYLFPVPEIAKVVILPWNHFVMCNRRGGDKPWPCSWNQSLWYFGFNGTVLLPTMGIDPKFIHQTPSVHSIKDSPFVVISVTKNKKRKWAKCPVFVISNTFLPKWLHHPYTIKFHAFNRNSTNSTFYKHTEHALFPYI